MATINVSSTAALNTALKAAKAGDTILLSTGTYTLNASGLTFASDVTVASANTGKPAVITSLAINDTMGLTLRDLELKAGATAGTNPFKVVDSGDIHFERLSVHGSLDGNPSNDGNVIRITIPELTKERRKEYVKIVKTKGEDAKVSIRNIRRKAKETLDRLDKDGEAGEDEGTRAEKELDSLTKAHVDGIDELLKRKEAELLEV